MSKKLSESLITSLMNQRAYFAIALAEVVQIECEGKLVGELALFCPGILDYCRISFSIPILSDEQTHKGR